MDGTGLEVSRAPTRRGSETRGALIDVAERLVAQRGVNGISLREVALAAHQHNRSAAQYHFGSRDGLIRAVAERRMAPLNQRRLEMIRELDLAGRSQHLRALVEVMVVPAVLALEDSRYFFRFLLQLVIGPPETQPLRWLDFPYLSAFQELIGRIDRLLADLDPAVRVERMRAGYMVTTHVIAAREQDVEDGLPVDLAFVATCMVDAILGILEAEDTTRALGVTT